MAAKRSILAEIPHEFTAEQEIDMTYGLLHLIICRNIPRDEIDTFDDLIGMLATLRRYYLRSPRQDASLTQSKRVRHRSSTTYQQPHQQSSQKKG